jgi:hypothetical protein
MPSFIVSILFTVCSFISFAQRAQRLMIAAQADIIKSDNDGFFEKVQGGLEGSLYLSRKFAATAGVEWWTAHSPIAVVGVRIRPIDEAFFRIRGLLRKDISLGAGFSKPLSDNFRVEAMADFYFTGHIAIRGGVACGIGARP